MAVPAVHDDDPVVPDGDRAVALARLLRLRLVPPLAAAGPEPEPELPELPESEPELPDSGSATSREPSAPESRPESEPESEPDSGSALWCVPGVRPVSVAGPSAVLQTLVRAVQAVRQARPTGSAVDTEVLLGLAEQLRGLSLRELAELDAVGGQQVSGARTSASWFKDTARVSEVTARATVRLAVRLRDEVPQLGALLCQGGTSLEHVRAVADGTAGLDRQVLRDSQDGLCALVQATDPTSVRVWLREKADAVRPELGREVARRARDRRGFYADSVAGVRVSLAGSLDGEDGQVLLQGLDLACEADRAAGDRRTLPQRRADVLVQWARQAAVDVGGPGDSLVQDAHTVRTHLLLTCTAEQLAAAASQDAGPGPADGERASGAGAAGGGMPGVGGMGGAGGGPAIDLGAPGSRPAGFAGTPGSCLTREALRRWACDATVSLVGVGESSRDADSGGRWRFDQQGLQPLYVGRSTRTVTGAQWKALVTRDRTCVVKGCRRRPTQCQAHHVKHWLDGGRTDLDNLVLLCHGHHHDHHDRGHPLTHRDGRSLTQSGWARGTPP